MTQEQMLAHVNGSIAFRAMTKLNPIKWKWIWVNGRPVRQVIPKGEDE
jgi:hypothetical protein